MYTIYVLRAYGGSYDDAWEEVLKAFKFESDADKACNEANQYHQEFVTQRYQCRKLLHRDLPRYDNPHHPDHDWWDTVYYDVIELGFYDDEQMVR